MTTFDEAQHPRTHTGQFAAHVGAEQPGGLDDGAVEETSEDLRWARGGFGLDEGHEWREAGFEPEDAGEWCAAGCPTPAEAREFLRASGGHGTGADSAPCWYADGFTAEETAEWRNAGFPHESEAYMWRASDVTPKEARVLREAGVRAKDASGLHGSVDLDNEVPESHTAGVDEDEHIPEPTPVTNLTRGEANTMAKVPLHGLVKIGDRLRAGPADGYRETAPEERGEIISQIGTGNHLAISGGRTVPLPDGVELPVSHGYSVRVRLAGNDTYTVQRVFSRAGKETIKGERTDVYVDEVGEAAYYASCFRSHGADEWPSAS